MFLPIKTWAPIVEEIKGIRGGGLGVVGASKTNTKL